jgi:DNA-binding CsgD family transcriptional regulator
MNLLSLFFVFAFMIYLYLGFYVLYLYKKSKLNGYLHKTFFVLSLVFSLWSINYAFLVSSGSKENCWFWYRLSLPALAFFPALLLHFFLVLTTRGNKPILWWLYPVLYIPGTLFLIKGLSGIFTVNDFTRNVYGWEALHTVGSVWYTSYTIYYISILMLCLVLTILWYNRTNSFREKKQAKIIFFTALATDIINIIIQNIIPALNINYVPKIAQIVILIWIFGIWYAIVKYKLMAPTPSLTSNEILSHINEMVIILSTELKIFMANDKFNELLSVKAKNINNKDIFDFIYMDEKLKHYFNLLMEGKEEKFRCKIYYKREPEPILTDSYISRITDKFSDLIGILLISRENKGIKQLQTAFKITDREFEIIDLTISGYSNKDIAEKLGITERTVETHLNNIYNKLAIKSKVELLNLAYDFNLIQKEYIH